MKQHLHSGNGIKESGKALCGRQINDRSKYLTARYLLDYHHGNICKTCIKIAKEAIGVLDV